jgi:hypothetical protein
MFESLGGLAPHPPPRRLDPVDRSSANGHANEEDGHRAPRKEGKLGIVTPAQRASDPKPNESNNETDPSPARPPGMGMEPGQAKTHDSADLKEHHQEFENRAETELSAQHDPTGSFLGSCE